MEKILILDNYDSFTYNIVHLLHELGAEVDIARNDRISVEEAGRYNRIILSPGPGIPSEAGILPEVVKRYAAEKSILGICLGEQAIGQAFGGKLTNLSEVFHGIQTNIVIRDEGLVISSSSLNTHHSSLITDYIFSGLPTEIPVGRYHSWVVDTEGFPEELVITAISSEGQIMALKHREYDVHGIQFHPESVLTPDGKQIVGNWLKGV